MPGGLAIKLNLSANQKALRASLLLETAGSTSFVTANAISFLSHLTILDGLGYERFKY